GRGRFRRPISESDIPAYRHKIIPLSAWGGLAEDFKAYEAGDGYSRNPLFRTAMKPLDFNLPAGIPQTGSVIVLATFAKSAEVEFTVNKTVRRVLVPFQYFQDDWTEDKLKGVIRKDILKGAAGRLVPVSKRVPLKYLAGRSGLGTMGRNNLIFVEGMGSDCLLHAFATDATLAGDALGEIGLLGECRGCHLCLNACPTRAIGRTAFSVDAGRCITLFNERPGEFPNWILPSMHHALMGCMKCQDICPENRRIPELRIALDAVTEEHTRNILGNKPDEPLTALLRDRLRLFPDVTPVDFHPILRRNLGVLLRA
ncbi:MAG: hypothetical protein JW843_01150, partial [Candidatus Aminicenantes bacterium]|nr:hypothetical protein [Candidatus Aminicenantes bacterium]